MLISMLRTFSPCSICADSIASCFLRKHFRNLILCWYSIFVARSHFSATWPEQSGAHIGIGQIKFQFCRGFCISIGQLESLEAAPANIMFGNSSWNSCLYHVIPCDHLLITRLFYYRRKCSLCFPNTFFLTITTGKDYTIRSFVVASVEDVYNMFYCVVPSQPRLSPEWNMIFSPS